MWDREPKRFGGLEIDDQLEFGRLLDRQITASGAFQDAIDIARSAAPNVENAGAIRDKAASIDEFADPTDPWESGTDDDEALEHFGGR